MEKIIIYAAIGIGYLIYQAMKAKSRNDNKRATIKPQPVSKPQTSQKSVSQPSSKSTPAQDEQVRKIFKQLGLDDFLDTKTEAKNTTSKSKAQQPFITNEVEKSREDHFSEENIIKRSEKAKKSGKELEHHTHHYVAEKEYQEEKSGTAHGDESYQKMYGQEIIKSNLASSQMDKKIHPIALSLKKTQNVRDAIVIKEILETKF